MIYFSCCGVCAMLLAGNITGKKIRTILISIIFLKLLFRIITYKNARDMLTCQYPIPVNYCYKEVKNTMFTLLKSKKYSDTFIA
jgi:hypothetical protein